MNEKQEPAGQRKARLARERRGQRAYALALRYTERALENVSRTVQAHGVVLGRAVAAYEARAAGPVLDRVRAAAARVIRPTEEALAEGGEALKSLDLARGAKRLGRPSEVEIHAERARRAAAKVARLRRQVEREAENAPQPTARP